MNNLRSVETGLTHLLAACWADHPGDAFDLYSWREYFQKAEFAAPDGGCSLVLETEASAATVRATLYEHGASSEWMLIFGHDLSAVEGADADALADTAWRMLRLCAEGAATAAAIDHPPEWHEARAA